MGQRSLGFFFGTYCNGDTMDSEMVDITVAEICRCTGARYGGGDNGSDRVVTDGSTMDGFLVVSESLVSEQKLFDSSWICKGIASLERAGPSEISFFYPMGKNNKEALAKTQAGACFLEDRYAPLLPVHTRPFLTQKPYRAFVTLAHLLAPPTTFVPMRHPTVHIHPSAVVDESSFLGVGVVVEAGARVGPRCWIGPYGIIGEGVSLEEECWIGPHVTLAHARLGKKVQIQTGARIGQTGFGFIMDDQGILDIPHQGKVILEEGVHIGANCTVDRGSFQDTVIGAFSRLDNLVQVAHNVTLGKRVVLCGLCGIAGSCRIEEDSILGGQVGVADHVCLGRGTKVAAKAGVMRHSAPGEILAGSPAIPIKQWRRQQIRQGFVRKEKGE